MLYTAALIKSSLDLGSDIWLVPSKVLSGRARHGDILQSEHCSVCFVAEGSFLQNFLADTATMNPDERGRFLEEPPEGGPDIDKAHEVKLLLKYACI